MSNSKLYQEMNVSRPWVMSNNHPNKYKYVIAEVKKGCKQYKRGDIYTDEDRNNYIVEMVFRAPYKLSMYMPYNYRQDKLKAIEEFNNVRKKEG